MQLPVQGKFEETPGWALRPVWAQQYGRSGSGGERPEWGQQHGRRATAMALRPGSTLSRQNERPAWGRQRMPETRAFLRGLGGAIPPAPFSYNPQEDIALKAQWTSQYYAQSQQFASAVLSSLQSMGFSVQLLGNSCDPGAGCLGLFQYQAVISKDGRSMDASIGNPVRFDSPQQEASEIASLFQIYATATQSFSSGINPNALVQTPTVPSSTPTYEQWLQTATQAPSAATTTTSGTAQTTTPAATYRKDVQILAPDGYRTGGRFTLKIWGRPGQTVEIAAWQNSLSHGRTPFGTTDSSGYFEISGVWGPEHAGRWQEDVYVGGEQVGRLDFEISAPQQQAQPDTVVVLPPASQPPQPGSGGAAETPSGGTGGGGSETPTQTGGISISPTVLLLGAAALVFILGGRK